MEIVLAIIMVDTGFHWEVYSTAVCANEDVR